MPENYLMSRLNSQTKLNLATATALDASFQEVAEYYLSIMSLRFSRFRTLCTLRPIPRTPLSLLGSTGLLWPPKGSAGEFSRREQSASVCTTNDCTVERLLRAPSAGDAYHDSVDLDRTAPQPSTPLLSRTDRYDRELCLGKQALVTMCRMFLCSVLNADFEFYRGPSTSERRLQRRHVRCWLVCDTVVFLSPVGPAADVRLGRAE
ncbi:hypothetical protein BD311DRAFT_391512 [Dichomitus squalens]|uniref:Uncharacterized protein n=1 Tax=Dichomitus squalens TaxID=114155 RepID=A0A4Q9MZY9_9APHY|nr:hypothetical protein BD311DRAFT_391512 [Dichomitus squalens]